MTTLSILKSDVDKYLARSDISEDVATFVRLAESRIRNKVRVRQMETTEDLAITSQSTALPSGFIELVRFNIDATSNRRMEYVPPDQGWRNENNVTNGAPNTYTIEGENLIVFPAPGAAIAGKINYIKAFDPLVNDDDTNWLLINAYDVYLYGCLAETKAFIEDDDQAMKWLSAFDDACEKVNRTSMVGRRGRILTRKTYAP